ncbi:hypothetical protein GCM10018793_48890 [Streptomyces sulfonofaciens]|uniref:Secreted protein n=1 Tax=Streptomyces sulfonofaciens TaxID=68272 RepID=A0A919L5E0_9ACTN|nr:SCO2322 family protein [Streptomyces sulfonofaciens]GHH84462.1 hypothetical protein GCM10018793_48890 [Streptomyces sulfonofaciens]
MTPRAAAHPTGARLLLLLALLGSLAAAGLADAGAARAAGYRYWSFWERDGGGWTYAAQGPSVTRPSDGDVQGFRFSVSEDSQNSAKPRGAGGFAAICSGTPAKPGTKRVALVIDPGTAADAPAGETPPAPRTACARLGPDATSAEALAAVAKPLRYDSHALLCAIAGYPRSGCGEQVPATRPAGGPRAHPSSSAAAASAPGHHIPSAGVVVGVGAVALLGVAAVWQARRRRD